MFWKSELFLVVLLLFCCTLETRAQSSNVSNASDSTLARNATVIVGTFNWADYSVLASMLLISCAIGVFYAYFGEKQTTSDDFLLGGSSMGTFPMAMSLAASFITAIELLGNPAEMYVAGGQFWMICVAFVLVIPIVSQLYLPVFMRLRLTSCYEYMEVRFCKAVRIYACVLYMIQMILYTAVAVYAPALALSDVTGLNTYLAVSMVYVVCIFYASQGGMKAVIMTDSFQSAVLLGSLVAILFLGAANLGGWGVIWDYASNSKRLEFFNLDPDPTVRHSFWSVVIGGTMYWLSMFCANQASVQKYLSVERMSQTRIALWVSAFGLIIVYSANFITGAILAAHYADCDPVQAGVISGSDRLLPLYVVTELGIFNGVPGFFVAGIFAASLGTVASALNSLAAIACHDIGAGLLGFKLPEENGAKIAKWVSLAFGAISFALVFLVERLGPVLQLTLSFNGMAGGVTLGLFSLGMLFPWANEKGAMAGGVAGLILVAIVGGGAQFTDSNIAHLPVSVEGCDGNITSIAALHNITSFSKTDNGFWLFRISYLWYSAIGCFVTLITGLVVSVLTGIRQPSEVPIDLLSPAAVKLFNSLPNKLKKKISLPRRLGSERRRSSSVRPPCLADDKDTRRRRRLSELAGGVFYSGSDSNTLTRGQDNLAMDTEKHPPEGFNHTSL